MKFVLLSRISLSDAPVGYANAQKSIAEEGLEAEANVAAATFYVGIISNIGMAASLIASVIVRAPIRIQKALLAAVILAIIGKLQNF